MAKKNASKKIIWALDPFSKHQGDLSSWQNYIIGLAKASGAKVEPVYILSPDGLNWSGDFSGHWVKRYEPLARAAAQASLSAFPTDIMLPLKVLVNPKMSLRRDVAAMSKYAKQQKAICVLVQTQSRKGLERWVLGSFAESMLLHSKVPVVAMNPHAKAPTHVSRVLFPTDLSAASKRAFKSLVSLCKLWQAELVICHKLPDPLEPIVQSGVYMAGGGWISLSQYFEKEGAAHRRAVEKLKSEAEKAKLKASVHVIEKPGLVADGILTAASVPGIDMIAMASQATGPSSVLIGSIARQVVRGSQIPVMVFHSGK